MPATAHAGPVRLVEALEDPRPVGPADPDAVVDHRDPADPSPPAVAHLDADLAAVAG